MGKLMCVVPECENAAREIVITKPGEAVILDGSWTASLFCGQGTHRAASQATGIVHYDPEAQVAVIQLSQDDRHRASELEDKAMYVAVKAADL